MALKANEKRKVNELFEGSVGFVDCLIFLKETKKCMNKNRCFGK